MPSDPESVLTNADIESAYWVRYPDQAADPITFARRVERLVRERLAKRFMANMEIADAQDAKSTTVAATEVLAIIRGEL